MLQFEWPWFLLALPIPWLARVLLRAQEPGQEAALRVPFLEDFRQQTGSIRFQSASWPLWLAALAWVFLVLAGMRPQWHGELIEIPVSGREMILAVDLSASMQEEDFFISDDAVDRLTAAKYVAGDFIERRVGDRIGLILFGETAYLQAPMTFDRRTVRTLLDEALIGLAGQSTAIGDAIGLAVKRLRERKESNRVVILLTDGANTAGVMEPLEAAKLATREGLKIYTIGVGADEMLVRSLFGTRRVNPSTDLDEETLGRIAELTGGKYFRARDTAELEQIYALLDELEPIEEDAKKFRPRKSLFYWPLSLAFIICTCLVALRQSGRTGG